MSVDRATRTGVLVFIVALALVGCSPGPSPSLEPSAGSIVRFEQAEIADGGLVLTLHFTGGPPYDPNVPCSNAYSGWARPDGDELEAAVVSLTPPSNGPCDLVGSGRTVAVPLAQPFTGSRVRDLAGGAHFVRRPTGALQLHGLPAGWTLRSEGDGNGDGDGQWLQTYSPAPLTNDRTTLHRLAIYQTFGEPTMISIDGYDEGVHVTVNGTSATLHGPVADGELLLVWEIGSNGLAFDANSADFSPLELISLADTATAP
jgi:hypothetical protein